MSRGSSSVLAASGTTPSCTKGVMMRVLRAAGDDQIAMQQQRRPDSHRGTVDGGDEDLAEAAQGAQEPRDHVIAPDDLGRIEEVLEIVASGEATAFTAE